METQNMEREVQRSLNRILPRMEEILKEVYLSWEQFYSRLHMLPLHATQIPHCNKDHYHEK